MDHNIEHSTHVRHVTPDSILGKQEKKGSRCEPLVDCFQMKLLNLKICSLILMKAKKVLLLNDL